MTEKFCLITRGFVKKIWPIDATCGGDKEHMMRLSRSEPIHQIDRCPLNVARSFNPRTFLNNSRLLNHNFWILLVLVRLGLPA